VSTYTPRTPRERQKLGAKLGGLRAKHPDRVEEIARLQAELRTEKIAKFIVEMVDQAPPLTQEQRDRLSSLLQDGTA
jgi:hypothetical protein